MRSSSYDHQQKYNWTVVSEAVKLVQLKIKNAAASDAHLPDYISLHREKNWLKMLIR